MYSILNEVQKNEEFPNIINQFIDYLPKKPYCTDELGTMLIRPKETALEKTYIQHNPIHRTYWFVFDIDSNEHRYWGDGISGLPTPNISVINNKNNHRHEYYLILPPTYTLRQARKKPLELAADVDRGLTELLGADPAYGKLISKNPLNKKWTTVIWHEMAWDLNRLIDYIPDKIKKLKRKPQEEIGLGRNCTVFEKARHYAYAQWRKQKFDDYDMLLNKTYQHAQNINYEFLAPMLEREVMSIARSISKWTARNHSAIDFSNIQRERGIRGNIKSQIIRSAKADARAEEVIVYKSLNPKATTREIANKFAISHMTVSRYLKIL